MGINSKSNLSKIALELAIESYEDNRSALSELEGEDSNVKIFLSLLAKKEAFRRPPGYKKYINLLEEKGLLKCSNNNYCKVTDDGRDLYDRYSEERDNIDRILNGFAEIDIRPTDIIYIISRGLDNLLGHINEYGLPKLGKYSDPFVEILFTEKQGSFTARILSTPYILALLFLYNSILSCKTSKTCINYYPTGEKIKKMMENFGIPISQFPSGSLYEFKLIKKVPGEFGDGRYTLTTFGEGVATHIALQVYIASHIY
jgi:hypothetical protein